MLSGACARLENEESEKKKIETSPAPTIHKNVWLFIIYSYFSNFIMHSVIRGSRRTLQGAAPIG